MNYKQKSEVTVIDVLDEQNSKQDNTKNEKKKKEDKTLIKSYKKDVSFLIITDFSLKSMPQSFYFLIAPIFLLF